MNHTSGIGKYGIVSSKEIDMLSVNSYGVHNPDDIKLLADWGFDFVCGAGCKKNSSWEREIKNIHNAGMQFIARWPMWKDLDLCDEEHAFRAYDGRTNATGDDRVIGPSVWNDDALDVALQSLDNVAMMGIDGVFISSLVSDRPFPTDWYPFGTNAIRGTTMYWSFDKDAQHEWARHSDGEPMPEQAYTSKHGGPSPDQVEFYRWYQGAWAERMISLSVAALQYDNIESIWSWFIPMTYYTPENMANGTANIQQSVLPVLRDAVENNGRSFKLVVKHLFDIEKDWPHWYLDAIETIRDMHNWSIVTGVTVPSTSGNPAGIISDIERKMCLLNLNGLYIEDSALLNVDRSQNAVSSKPGPVQEIGTVLDRIKKEMEIRGV